MAIVLILWFFLAFFLSLHIYKQAYLFLRTTDERTMWVFAAVRPFHVYIICGYDFLLSLRWTARAHYYYIYIFGRTPTQKKTMNYSIIFAVHLQCPTNTSHDTGHTQKERERIRTCPKWPEQFRKFIFYNFEMCCDRRERARARAKRAARNPCLFIIFRCKYYNNFSLLNNGYFMLFNSFVNLNYDGRTRQQRNMIMTQAFVLFTFWWCKYK